MARVGRFVALLGAMASVAASAQSGPHIVGVLVDQDAVGGCSWSASSASVGNGDFFLADFHDSVVVMNIRGKDVRLKINPARTKGSLRKVGDHLTKTYVASGVVVDVTYTASRVCRPSEAECEDVKFDATFKVTQNGQTQVIAAQGDAGC